MDFTTFNYAYIIAKKGKKDEWMLLFKYHCWWSNQSV